MSELKDLGVNLSSLCREAGWQAERAVTELLRQTDLSRQDAEAFVAFIVCAKLDRCCGKPDSHLSDSQLARITADGPNWILLR